MHNSLELSFFRRIAKLLPNRLKSLDWAYLVTWLISAGAAIFVLTFDLAGVTSHQISHPEQLSITASSSLSSLLNNAVLLPYRFLEWILFDLGASHVFILRIAPVILALVSVWLFLSIARHWFNRPTYMVAAVLFATSPWILHFGRLAIPGILNVIAPLAAIRLLLWLKNLQASSNRHLIIFVLAATVALTLYIPGVWAIWLIIAVWQFKKLGRLIKTVPTAIVCIGSIFWLLLLTPLLLNFAYHPSFILDWLGFNHSNWILLDVLKRVYQWPMYLFGYGPGLPSSMWLGHQSLLAVFPAAAAVLGGYYYFRNFRLRQAKLIGSALLIAWAFFIISGSSFLGFAVGPIFLLSAAGICYLIKLWHQVFPRNPLAYSFAIVLISLAAALTVIYTTRSYFVAWRHDPATSRSYNIKL